MSFRVLENVIHTAGIVVMGMLVYRSFGLDAAVVSVYALGLLNVVRTR